MTTLPVRPVWTVDLPHAAIGVASAAGGRRIAIASEGPLISVAEIGEPVVQSIKLTEPARDVAVDAAGDALAIVSASHTLRVVGIDSRTFGHELVRSDAPVHDASAFSRDGRVLWTVGSPSDDVAVIRCYEARSLAVVGEHRFKPAIGGCGFILTVHPQQDVLGLWVVGGPDHVWNYWIRLTTSGIDLQHQPELDGATPPCFDGRGDRFAVLNEDDVRAFSFPACQPVSGPVTPPDEEDAWAESMCYVNAPAGDRVLASTNEGRIFMVVLDSGEAIAEIELEGHEPKPCYQVYTKLSPAHDQRLCTDLHGFMPVGDGLIRSTHTNGRSSDRKDTILLWRAPIG
jgi:hypothetical protein